MTEIIVLLALASLLWLVFNLYRAKQYNKFLAWLEQDIKPLLITQLELELEQSRSDATPNNEAHQKATKFYWSEHKVRIFQGALAREIIEPQWLEKPANRRLAMHLMHRQHQYKIDNL